MSQIPRIVVDHGEAPIYKYQITNKCQITNSSLPRYLGFANWRMELIWNLDIVDWIFLLVPTHVASE